MSTFEIKISELRSKNGENVNDLVEYLKGQVDAKINVGGSEINVDYEDKKRPPKSYIRTVLRKFLHRAELKEQFRVIAGKEDTFIIKERKQ
jgi:hypothetical protein